MTNWTPERHEAAKARCEIAKCQPWTENHVSRTDLPDALAEIERLQAANEALRKDFCSDHCKEFDRRGLCDENERRRQEVREANELTERARRIKDEAVAENTRLQERLFAANEECAKALTAVDILNAKVAEQAVRIAELEAENAALRRIRDGLAAGIQRADEIHVEARRRRDAMYQYDAKVRGEEVE